MLACAIAGTIPLALWGGACGKRPIVEPTADSGIDSTSDHANDLPAIDRPYAVDLVGTDVPLDAHLDDGPVTGTDVPPTVDAHTDGAPSDLAIVDTAPDQVPDQAIDRATDQASDPAGDQGGQDLPDGAIGCCSSATSTCSADGRSVIACRMVMNQCNPVGIYGFMWMTQDCPDGCVMDPPDGHSDAAGPPHCR